MSSTPRIGNLVGVSENTAADAALTAHGLTLTYGKGNAQVHALRGVDTRISHGRWTSIMGPSGSGKTTLLHCLAGLTTPDAGKVILHNSRSNRSQRGDVDITRLSTNARAKLRRTRIGVIFQEFNLLPVLSVQDNLLLPSRLAGETVDNAWKNQVIDHLGLGSRLSHLPSELSGGQRQRVAIGRAILTKPDVILADEPTGSLDSETGDAVLALFRDLVQQWEQTLVMVTHDAHAARQGDEIIHMADGHIVQHSPAEATPR